MAEIHIALDAMGGDHGPSVVIPAAVNAMKKCPELHLHLCGDTVTLKQLLQGLKYDEARLSIVHTTEVVAMDEPPSRALRSKKDSSMRVAINLVKAGVAQACVSSGNTGALMATARFVLKTLPGIDRPAIISEMPSPHKPTRVLDLGANVDSCAEYLLQFAVMGSEMVAAVDNIKNPTVGLLNIGEEEIKGNDQVKRTSQLLQEQNLVNYVGYVEADMIYRSEIDVIVCDGFVGNIALKASEGIANLLLNTVKASFQQSLFTRLVGKMCQGFLGKALDKLDPARFNGATFLGLQGTVVKSHGGANAFAFEMAIYEAMKQAKHDVPTLIAERVATLLNEGGL